MARRHIFGLLAACILLSQIVPSALLASRVLAIPDAQGANLLLNPSFEADANSDGIPDDWVVDYGDPPPTFILDNSTAHSGQFSARFSIPPGAGGALEQPRTVFVQAGMNYVLSLWVKADTTAANIISTSGILPSFVFYDAQDNPLPSEGQLVSPCITGGWETGAVYSVAPAESVTAGAFSVGAFLAASQGGATSPATIWFDDVSFTQSPPPAPQCGSNGPTATPIQTPTVIAATATSTQTPAVVATTTATPTRTPTVIVATATPTRTPTAVATPTATPTQTPAVVVTPTVTRTPYPQPNVAVLATPVPAQRSLQVTITARNAGCSPDNQLSSLQFTRLSNATVDVPGFPRVTGPSTISLPSHPASAALTVRRVTDGQAATVELVATDGCGDWRTFVGGGPNAW